jgi:hypothetical protein
VAGHVTVGTAAFGLQGRGVLVFRGPATLLRNRLRRRGGAAICTLSRLERFHGLSEIRERRRREFAV